MYAKRNAWGGNMHENEILQIMQEAIQTADIYHPDVPGGAQHDAIYRSQEESQHLALAAIIALRNAGFEIVKVKTDAKRP
jgi:hypothetical protein